MTSVLARRLGRVAAYWLVMACLPASSRAHGGPPSAFGIVVADASQPRVVLVNEGLAMLRGGEWSYVCPRLWGDASTTAGKLPLAVAAPGPDSLIIGTDDLYVLRDGAMRAQGRADLGRNHVIAVAADQEAVFGVRLVQDGSELVRISAGQEPTSLWKSPRVWSALAVDASGLHLGTLAGANLIALTHVDRQGSELAPQQAQLDLKPSELWVRTAAGRVFVVATDGALSTLAESTPSGVRTLRREVNAIAGPLASGDGSLWLAVGGQLMHAAGPDAFEPVAEPRQVTCLERWNEYAYACVGSELYRLTNAGLGERLFELRGLRAPDPSLYTASGAPECELQWLLFSNDLELAGLSPREWGAAAAGAPGFNLPVAGAPAVGAAGVGGGMSGALASDATAQVAPAPTRSGCSVSAPRSSTPFAWLLGSSGVWLACARRCARNARARCAQLPALGRWSPRISARSLASTSDSGSSKSSVP